MYIRVYLYVCTHVAHWMIEKIDEVDDRAANRVFSKQQTTLVYETAAFYSSRYHIAIHIHRYNTSSPALYSST